MKLIETTSRKFRDHQKDFMDMADSGKKVIIRRGNKSAYLLTPISEDDLYFTDEVINRIKQAEEQIKKGEYTKVRNKEELNQFFDGL